MGITIDCGPIKTEVKHLFGGVVSAMMSPGGSIVASLKNINGFLAMNTPPDDLIRIDFKQEGVIPKVMLHIFEEFVLLLGRHPFHNKVPRMVVCKIGKPREVHSAITDDGTGVPNLEKRDFKNLQTTRASLVESAFASTHFENVVRAMMSPGGSIVASLENVNGFLAVYTPSDDLIRTDFEKKGVVPEVMLHILEEFVLLLGRHFLNNEIPRMVVCKVDKPYGT
nr:hypothetical protein [Tanacetum cinerariifolium]